MAINSNDELRKAVNAAIKDSGIKKIWIAEQLGMTRQALTQLMGKQSFSLDDANKILAVIGCETTADVNKK